MYTLVLWTNTLGLWLGLTNQSKGSSPKTEKETEKKRLPLSET